MNPRKLRHLTATLHTAWAMDSIERISEDNVIFRGWILDWDKPYKEIHVNKKRIKFKFIERADVLKYYGDYDVKNKVVGVEFTIAKKDITSQVHLKYEDNSTEYIGTLEEWYVNHSGLSKSPSDLIVVDNFYDDPDAVRNFAINNLEFKSSPSHRGHSTDRWFLEGTKAKFEGLLGREVTNWNADWHRNGSFQYNTSYDPIVYHVDEQSYAGVVFLTPDAPLEAGTAFYKSKYTGETRYTHTEPERPSYDKAFTGRSENYNFYDSTCFEKLDEVVNVYNRLVIWDSHKIHAASKYFGDNINNSRFIHLFFFDVI